MSVNQLYFEYREALLLTVYRIVGCQQTAEDITHEAYLRLMQAHHSHEVEHPKPYLFQIGRNLALDHLRKQRIRYPAQDEWLGDDTLTDPNILPDLLPSPDEQIAVQQEVERMLAALAELTERRREILVLHKFHHWDYARIASHVGISVSAVEKNIYKAVKHLLAKQAEK